MEIFRPESLLFYAQLTVLWDRNYFLRFQFRFLLLKSYGSGSGSGTNFWKSYGSGSYFWKKVMVPVSVPAPYVDHKKQIFPEKFWNFFLAFLHSKLFYKGKVDKFQQIYCKMWMKKNFKWM